LRHPRKTAAIHSDNSLISKTKQRKPTRSQTVFFTAKKKSFRFSQSFLARLHHETTRAQNPSPPRRPTGNLSLFSFFCLQ